MDVEEVVWEGGSPEDRAWDPISHCAAAVGCLLSWFLVWKLPTGFYSRSVKEQERSQQLHDEQMSLSRF